MKKRVAARSAARGAPKRQKCLPRLQAARDSAVEGLRLIRRGKGLGLDGLEQPLEDLEKKQEKLIAELMLRENDDSELPADVIDKESRETMAENLANLEKLEEKVEQVDKQMNKLEERRKMLFEEKKKMKDALQKKITSIRDSETVTIILTRNWSKEKAYFRIKRFQSFEKLFDVYAQRGGVASHTLRFLFKGEQIRRGDTPEKFDLIDNDEIDVLKEQSGHVGVFDTYGSFPGSDLLSLPRESFNDEQEKRVLARAVRSLPPSPGLKKNQLLEPFWSLHRNRLNLVAPSQRQSLMDLLDKHFAESASVDVKVDLEKDELVSYIGSKAYEELEELFCAELGGRPSALLVRRVSAVGLHIAFHHDDALRTMQVALNEDYCGGRLAFVEEDPSGGLKLVEPDRPAGSITCHNNGVVHGVTRFESGVRYSLFLLQK